MSKIIYISESNFKSFLQENEGSTIILECFSNSSGPLQIMEPILERLRAKYQKKLVHCRINIEENPFIIDMFYILNEPTYLIFYNGDVIDRIDGMIPFNAFADTLEKHIR